MKLNFKLMTYDIETSYLKARIWRLGEQRLNYSQLEHGYEMYKIWTISYKWYDKKEIVTLTGKNAIKQFDEQVKKADVVIGKNNQRFDDKYINTQRMLAGELPMPQWALISDDLEKQLRKFFVFPSCSLDAISKLFGLGGKIKMEWEDWVDIDQYEKVKEFLKLSKVKLNSKVVEAYSLLTFGLPLVKVIKAGQAAWKKMIFYNKKDVRDTENILRKVLPYIQLRHNAAVKINPAIKKDDKCCILCGSSNISPTRIITVGKTKYQEFYCYANESRPHYAGKSTFRWNKSGSHKIFGTMG